MLLKGDRLISLMLKNTANSANFILEDKHNVQSHGSS